MYTKLPIELKPNNAKKSINSSRKTTIRFFTIDQREWLYNTTFHKDKYLLQEFFFFLLSDSNEIQAVQKRI